MSGPKGKCITLAVLLLWFSLHLAGQSSPSIPAWHSLTLDSVIGKAGYRLAGPVNAIVADPADPNVFYAGTFGGVWKTTDGGNTWRPTTDDQPLDLVVSLALDPNDNKTIWAGLSHGDLVSDISNGGESNLLKSTDGGATWSGVVMNSSVPLANRSAWVYQLAVQPGDSKVLLAATDVSRAGIYRTSDGGSIWTQVYSCPVVTHIVFDPRNGQKAFATCKTPGIRSPELLRSDDAGQSWHSISTFLNADSESDLSVGISADARVLYLSMTDASASMWMWRSFDLGETWQVVQQQGPYQFCFYTNHVVLVSPADDNTVLRGCDTIYLSRDAGATWTNIAADLDVFQTGLVFAADGSLITANDHGVWKTPVLGGKSVPLPFPYSLYSRYPAQKLPWQNLNAGLDVQEFRRQFAVDPTGSGRVLASSLFDGTIAFDQKQWIQVVPGIGNASLLGNDGSGYSIIYNPTSGPWEQWPTFTNVWRSSTPLDPNSWLRAGNGYPRSGGYEISGFAIAPSDAGTLYGAHTNNPFIYRSTDGARSWTQLTPPGSDLAARTLSVDAQNRNNLWALTTPATLWVANDAATSQNPDWIECSQPANSYGWYSSVRSDPITTGTAWLAGGLFASDGTYAHASLLKITNLCAQAPQEEATRLAEMIPEQSLDDVAVDPAYPDDIYVGSAAGVHVSLDGGSTWSAFNAGLPRTTITGLQIDGMNRVLYAATAGRGMWATALPPAPAELLVAPTTLQFPDTVVGSTSAPASVMLSNPGGTEISLQAITLSGDFTDASQCGGSLAAQAHCTLNVTFAPTTTGVRTGVLSISAGGKTFSVALSGNGVPQPPPPPQPPPALADFRFSSGLTELNVNQGQSVQDTLQVTALNGFSGTVNFACSGLPASMNCSFSPTTVNMNSHTGVLANVTLTISSAQIQSQITFWTTIQFAFALCVGACFGDKRRLRLLCLASTLLLAGCRGLVPQPLEQITSTSNVQVTASSGAIQHAINLRVIELSTITP